MVGLTLAPPWLLQVIQIVKETCYIAEHKHMLYVSFIIFISGIYLLIILYEKKLKQIYGTHSKSKMIFFHRLIDFYL